MTKLIDIQFFDQKSVKLTVVQNRVSKSSIRTAFLLPKNALVRLSYFQGDQKCLCGYEKPYFILPSSIESLKFIVESDKLPLPVQLPARSIMNEEPPSKKSRVENEDQASVKDILWFQNLQRRVLYFEDCSNVKCCVTPISKNLVATCAHDGNRNLTIELTKETPIIIRNYFDENYRVPARIVKRSEDHGLLILQSIETPFSEDYFRIVSPSVGTRYIRLGLSNDKYERRYVFSPSVGRCKKMLRDHTFVGSSGLSRDDWGAGIWNSSCQLLGMSLNETHVPDQTKKPHDEKSQDYRATGGLNVFIPAGFITLFASSFLPCDPDLEFEE